MSLKDIEKLRERVEKDPNSKLFVPLAEEYRKEGMLDDAINVLLIGLEKQPDYMSARVSLGKVYLEKDMREEARTEFESVIKAIPDNLYAHKKLAEIYRDAGQKDLARKSFKTVLKLSPMDEDTLDKLKEIEDEDAIQQPSEESAAVEVSLPEETTPLEEGLEETASADTAEESVLSEKTEVEPAQLDEELTAFQNSIFGSTEKAAKSLPGNISVQADEDEDIEILDDPVEEAEEEISFGDISEVPTTEGVKVQDIPEEITEEGVKEKIFTEEKKLDIDATEPLDEVASLEEAEKHISRGNYIEAINTYKILLSPNPDDKDLLQQIEDLKMLLKLMGKDKEVLISRLNVFKEAVNKRHDEFFRSS